MNGAIISKDYFFSWNYKFIWYMIGFLENKHLKQNRIVSIDTNYWNTTK